MKKIAFIVSIFLVFASCKKNQNEEKVTENLTQNDTTTAQIKTVAVFKGQQVTGVSVAQSGRIFVNFPRWRKGVINSVLEISEDKSQTSFPDKNWNSWEIGENTSNDKFVGVQSVLAFEDNLFVLDTRSAMFKNVLDAPRVFVFNLESKKLVQTYIFDEKSYHKDSYINDLRIDKKKNKIYFTDSGHAGLIVLDRTSGKFKRILDNHKSTSSEKKSLTFGKKEWKNSVNSDGIALDTKNDRLYYHALTGYTLYSLPTNAFELTDDKQIEEVVKLEAKTSAPDGMILDSFGNLYYADLENNKILYRKTDGSVHTLAEGEKIKWADTFSIYNNELYFTNSRINEVTNDISGMTFTLNKIQLPAN